LIKCGFSHTILLTRENNIIEFGEMDNVKKIETIKQSKWNYNPIVDIRAGDSYNLILTIDGSVFGYGYNTNGSIGFEKNNKIIPTPTRITELNEICKIESKASTSYFLHSNILIYNSIILNFSIDPNSIILFSFVNKIVCT